MSKEMREHIDRVKNWKQFLNESKTEQYDSFIINIKYDVGYSDIDTKNILTSALQKTYKGWSDRVIFDNLSFDYKVKNSDVELRLIDSKYDDETYEVIYNQNREEYDEFDNENDIFKFVKKNIEKITHYTYRSIHSMDKRQKADIKILSVSKVGG
jgi:hypothetical protein